jgi:O-antigen/teichoic acid export membrane protein
MSEEPPGSVADGGPAPTAPALLAKSFRVLAGRAGIVLISFGFAIALAQALVPARRGDFALVQALAGLTAVLGNFAISKAVIHHFGKRILPVGAAITGAVVLALLSGGMAALVFIPLGLGFHKEVLPGLDTLYIVAAIALATGLLAREYLGGVSIAVGRPQDYIGSLAVQPFVALGILLVLILTRRTSVGTVVVAWSAGIVASAATLYLLASRYRDSRARLKASQVWSLARFGIRTYPAFVARFLNLRIDQFLVRILTTAAILGQYAVAVNVGELLIRIPNLMLAALSGAISSEEPEASQRLVAQFSRWAIVVLAAAAVVIGLATPLMPLVFGQSYRPAVGGVLLLLPGMVCYAPATIIVEYFIVQRGRPAKAAMIAGGSILISVVLNLILTPPLGVAGASLASSASYAGMLGTACWLFSKDTGKPIRDLVAVSRSDVRTMIRAMRSAVRTTHVAEHASGAAAGGAHTRPRVGGDG